MACAVKIENLVKRYKELIALDHFSLEINEGEVFGLLGHNGAGKSTTIEMILGLKKPDAGELTIFGMEAAKHRKEVFEKVGVQFQTSAYQEAIRVDEVCEEYASLYNAQAEYYTN